MGRSTRSVSVANTDGSWVWAAGNTWRVGGILVNLLPNLSNLEDEAVLVWEYVGISGLEMCHSLSFSKRQINKCQLETTLINNTCKSTAMITKLKIGGIT